MEDLGAITVEFVVVPHSPLKPWYEDETWAPRVDTLLPTVADGLVAFLGSVPPSPSPPLKIEKIVLAFRFLEI